VYFIYSATWVEGGFINGTAEAVYASGLVGSQAPFAYSVCLAFSEDNCKLYAQRDNVVDCDWMAILTIVWKKTVKIFGNFKILISILSNNSNKKFTNTDIIKMSELLIDTIFVMFWWVCLSTDRRHHYGYILSSSSSRLVPLLA
jgi:hypothetical protein